MAHITRGHFSPWMTTDVVELVITGANNRDKFRTGWVNGQATSHTFDVEDFEG